MTDSDKDLDWMRSRVRALDEAWDIALKSDSIHTIRLNLYLLCKQAIDAYDARNRSETTKETTNV